MNRNFCLCCLKPLSEDEQSTGYHRKCLKKLFGHPFLPQVELSDDILEALARKASSKGITVAGVQKKLSLHLASDKKASLARLTLIGHPQGYILKPQSADFPFLPESEQIVMTMAQEAKIQTVPHSLILSSDQKLSYITKRIDRLDNGDKTHMEDFCQLSQRLTEDKYKGSYEQCAKIIQKFSTRPGLDISEFFYRLVFCFITGNSDMHLKNFSLIQSADSSWILSPAYDLLPVNLIMSSDTEETALTLNGKKSKITRRDFLAFAETAKIPEAAADKMISRLLLKKDVFLNLAMTPLLPQGMQEQFANLIEERCSRLQ